MNNYFIRRTNILEGKNQSIISMEVLNHDIVYHPLKNQRKITPFWYLNSESGDKGEILLSTTGTRTGIFWGKRNHSSTQLVFSLSPREDGKDEN